jgi:orotidine-5'-phosphate decarboxylase
MAQNFVDRLRAAQEARDTWLCVGLDPTPSLMPAGVDLLEFGRMIIDATREYVCAYKPNLMFYLAYGADGIRALQETIAHVPDDTPVILDAKFGDISYTAEHYARSAYDVLGADAVTVSPYAGMDAVTPLLSYTDKMAFVLVRSSNRSGNDFQLWPSERAPLYRFVTAQVNTLARDNPDQLGMIVSATQPRDLVLLRSWAPSIPFLIPGLGVQEGDLDTAVQHGTTRSGVGPIISVTRAIIYASQGDDFAEAASRAAREWVERIRQLRAVYQPLR